MLFVIVLIGVITGGTLFGIEWWNRRPLRQAESALERNQILQAAKLVDNYLARHGGDGAALSLKARVLVAQGRWSEAALLFNHFGAAEPEAMRDWSTALIQLERWSSAAIVLESLLEMEPDNPELLYDLAACRERLGEYEEALKSARQLSEIEGHEAQACVLIGSIEFNRGNKRSAAEAWNKVLRYAPDAEGLQVTPGEFFAQYGEVLLETSRPRDAVTFLERAVGTEETVQAYVALGRARLQVGEVEEAVEAWKKALEMEPGSRHAREEMAQVALRKSDAEQALEWLAPILDDTNLRSSTAFLLQQAYTRLGKSEEAAHWKDVTEELRRVETRLSTLEQFRLESPHSFWAQIYSVYRFADAGNWDQAAQRLELLMNKRDEENTHDFVRDLAEAIRTKGELPSLDRIPIDSE